VPLSHCLVPKLFKHPRLNNQFNWFLTCHANAVKFLCCAHKYRGPSLQCEPRTVCLKVANGDSRAPRIAAPHRDPRPLPELIRTLLTSLIVSRLPCFRDNENEFFVPMRTICHDDASMNWGMRRPFTAQRLERHSSPISCSPNSSQTQRHAPTSIVRHVRLISQCSARACCLGRYKSASCIRRHTDSTFSPFHCFPLRLIIHAIFQSRLCIYLSLALAHARNGCKLFDPVDATRPAWFRASALSADCSSCQRYNLSSVQELLVSS